MYTKYILITLTLLTTTVTTHAMQTSNYFADFTCEDLPYNGVSISSCQENLNQKSFLALIDHIKELQKQSIFIRRPFNNIEDIPFLLSQGFKIHHTTENHFYLTKWLNPLTQDAIPRHLSHSIGVGAMIINTNNEILVVKEKQRGFYNDSRIEYKIPTGHVEQSEDMIEALKREVKEEVGIDTTFKRLVGFWQELKYGIFQVASLYFVFLLEPTDEDQPINKDEHEIKEALWMPYNHFKKIKKFKPMHYFFAAYENPLGPLIPYCVNTKTISVTMFLPSGIDSASIEQYCSQ